MSLCITSVSGSQSLASFPYSFFHFGTAPGLRLALDAAERRENVVAFSDKKIKRAAAEVREREEYSSARGQCNRGKVQSHLNELSRN